jgi:hypothetical protein
MSQNYVYCRQCCGSGCPLDPALDPDPALYKLVPKAESFQQNVKIILVRYLY